MLLHSYGSSKIVEVRDKHKLVYRNTAYWDIVTVEEACV